MDSSSAVGGEIDMISNLHESILGHTLSFLPTIEAVQTSVLSTRWIHVWKSIKTLVFDDDDRNYKKMMQKEEFVCFVNNVLLHFSNSTIQDFSLRLTRYNYDSSQVSAWISSVLDRGVQKLHIQYADKILLSSSHSLFSCNSVVELQLQMRCTLNLPISASLPNLQSLRLSGIRLVSDSDSSEDIILNFPVLKVFEARSCEWLTLQDISIQAPSLERFSIAIWNSLSSSNDQTCSKLSAIKVFSSKLTDFSYEGDLEQEIILYDPSSVRSASVVIVIDEDRKNRSSSMEKLVFQAHMFLRQIHQVERLKLLFYKVLMHAKDIFTHLPTFGRLTYLQLNEVTGEALLHLLHHSPSLHTLDLLNGVSDLNKDLLKAPSSVPLCILSSFKVFEYKGFSVKEHELSLAKFVLANATILERVTICSSFWLRYSDIDMEKVKEQILSLPKSSNFCLVEIF